MEKNSRVEVVAKLYEGSHAVEVRDREFANLNEVKRLGFCQGAMRAACPYLSLSQPVAILMERAKGRDLDHYLKWAIRGGREEKLKEKLLLLARWFSLLHSKSAKETPAGGRRGYKYLMKVVAKLEETTLISPQEAQYFQRAGESTQRNISGQDQRVFVHGDATPTNLFFRGEQVTAIDFERAKVTHRCWDLGFVGGELIHHFKWRGGDKEKGREFFKGFLLEYSHQAGIPLPQLEGHLSLYLAMGLLRIARNPWLDMEHRRWLVERAQEALGS